MVNAEKDSEHVPMARSVMALIIYEKLKKQWFLIGVATVIMLAKANPLIGLKGGKFIVNFLNQNA